MSDLYATNLPCEVCGKASRAMRNKIDERFGYVTCPKHAKVPPAFLDVARRQFQKRGETDWG